MTGFGRLPTYYIPHGGGPCFFIRPEDIPVGMPYDLWDHLADYLRGIAEAVGRRPRAVLVVTAHWMVAAGAAGNDIGHKSFAGMIGGKPLSGITFGKGE